jgi:uncharacterized protein
LISVKLEVPAADYQIDGDRRATAKTDVWLWDISTMEMPPRSSANSKCDDIVQSEVIAFLRDPSSWIGHPQQVEVIETHGALIFLAGDSVLKMKRAVRLSYLDFSTLSARHKFSKREFEINNPHAPGLYRGVVAITREANGQLAIGGQGTPVEWVVHMHRFSQDQLLSSVVKGPGIPDTMAIALADAIVAYHQSAPPNFDADDPVESVAHSIHTALSDNTDQRITEAADRFQSMVGSQLSRSADIRRERIEAGCIRRCHGDLHLNNIVLWQGAPVPFDAIEFDEALATVDTLYDLAFLLMDLERSHARITANLVLNRYLWRIGEAIDLRGLSALPLYLGLRAGVRAMVAIDRARLVAKPDTGIVEHLLATMAIADRCLDPPPPRLIAVGGLSGTGKTVLSAGLAPLFGAVPGALHLRTDLERKLLAGVGELERLPVSSYTAKASEVIYQNLVARARMALRAGHSVILDGVFARQAERWAIQSLADEFGVFLQAIWLEGQPDVLKSRVASRMGDASDATPDVVDLQRNIDTGPITWQRIDASRPKAVVLADAISALGLHAS